MVFKKNLSRASISLLIFIVIMAPFVHSSLSHGGTKPARDTPMSIQVRFVKGLGVDEDNHQSARQVPTGPDPLHHNGNPARP